ncbi:MAG: hypothetical protein JWO83_2086 [Caulobacteraceae bacterium]|nr:hypothetical protein [Caulobacteraceae bacterium]
MMAAGALLGFIAAGRTMAQTTLEAITVTAEKRGQAIQTVPASITALPRSALELRQLDNIADIATQVPNLYFSESNGVEEVGIRGVVVDTTNPAVDPSIALHLDGVYQPRVSSMNLLVSDLDSIEVLRGPQGTLYGRNATGGVINVITRKPTGYFEAGLSALAGNYDRYMVKGYISGPIAHNLDMRISGIVDNRQGYGENLFTGSHGSSNEWSAKIALRFRPTDNLIFDLSAYHLSTRSVGPLTYAVTPIGGPNVVAFPPQQTLSTTEPFRAYNGFNSTTSTEQTGVTATIDWTFAEGVKLKSITGYVQSRYRDDYDSDSMPVNLIEIRSNYPSTMYSQEFDLSTSVRRLDALVGFYYLHEDVDNHSFDVFASGEPDFGVPPFNINIDMPQVTTSVAGFVDLTYRITDRMRLLGGVRETYDSKDVRQTFELQNLGGFVCQDLPGAVASMSTTGKIGAQYDLTGSTMAYAQWQSGFKAAGYNFSICGNQFHPEEIRAWEGGLKGRYFDGRLTLYASIFYYNYTNMQLYRVTGVSAIVDNAGRSTLYGAELEGAAQLTDQLKADWALSWLHARYDVYSAINTALPQPSPLENLSGNTMIKAPNYTLRLGVEYKLPLADLGYLTVRGEAYHSDTVYFTAFNEAIAKQGPYTLENIFIRYEPRNSHYQLTAFVKNIGNKSYLLSGYTLGAFFPNSGYGMYGDPRTMGVEVSARF